MRLQEKQALETFSVQRDALMKEVSDLQIAKDKLNVEMKQLLDSITSTREELEQTNGLIKAQLKGEGAVSEMVQATISSLKKDVEHVRKEKDQVTTELTERTNFLRDTSSSVEKIGKEVAQMEESLKGIYKDIHNASTWMKEAVIEVQQIVNTARDNSKKFTEDFVKYEQEAAERLRFLDKKESLIFAREKAVDDRYRHFINKMKDGVA